MRFDAAAFDQFLAGIGQRVKWRRSFACACSNPQTGQPDPKHQLCMGKGRLWADPVETVVGVASQKVQLQWAQMGLWEAGDTVLSVPQASPVWDAGAFDRILMLDSTDVFSQPMVRGAPSEKLLFDPVKITRCFWLHPVTREPIDGGLPVFKDGKPDWEGRHSPPLGATYSLTGEKNSEFFLYMDLASDRNQHQGVRLPKRIVARKFDLFNR